MKRTGAVTFKGGPVDLKGRELKVGDQAPDFKLQDTGLADVSLASTPGKSIILVVVPSLDTSVCSLETKKFNDAAKANPNVQIYSVSMDLPFAMKRWCAAEGVENVKAVSAHRCTDFGSDYGVLISGGPLDRILCRAVFVVGADGKVKHVEYVKEIASEPDYDAALAAAR